MNGPDHYLEAERLAGTDWGSDFAPMALAAAQVHATLALTAAIATTPRPVVDGFESLAQADYRGWAPAVGAE